MSTIVQNSSNIFNQYLNKDVSGVFVPDKADKSGSSEKITKPKPEKDEFIKINKKIVSGIGIAAAIIAIAAAALKIIKTCRFNAKLKQNILELIDDKEVTSIKNIKTEYVSKYGYEKSITAATNKGNEIYVSFKRYSPNVNYLSIDSTDGLLKVDKHVDYDGKIKTSVKEFFEDGSLKSVKDFEEDGKILKSLTEYWSNGQEKCSKYFCEDGVTPSSVFEYSEDGRILR